MKKEQISKTAEELASFCEKHGGEMAEIVGRDENGQPVRVLVYAETTPEKLLVLIDGLQAVRDMWQEKDEFANPDFVELTKAGYTALYDCWKDPEGTIYESTEAALEAARK